MSIWIWLLMAAGVAILFIAIRSSRRKARDRAVLEDFRNWSTGQAVPAPAPKTGFAALSERERELSAPSPASSSGGNPVCGNCQTTYNRQEVIRLIKQQSPEIFEFSTWTTRFVCKVCRTEIVLSGSRGE